jgi:hypothetical protein
MLTIAYRTTEQIPLYETIESYIVKYHGPNEFNQVKPHIKEIDSLWDEIALMSNTDDPILLQKYNTMFIEYYVAINFLS